MKPILFNIPAFDATVEYEFNFSYAGNQPHKNRLIIKNNTTDETVYDETLTTMSLTHTLSAESLTNQTGLYNAQIQTYDISDTASDLSDAILFYCLAEPTFEFSNLTEGQTIQNATFSPILTYSQTQSELLDSYQITLYDSGQVEVTSTDTNYDTSSTLTGTFSSLEDSHTYYLRAIGETVNGMVVDTGYVSFTVDYVQPVLFELVEIENVPSQGSIRIASNITSCVGTSTPDSISYISNTSVDLSDSGSNVVFDEGFNIESDFTMQIDGYGFTANSIIVEMQNDSLDRIEILYKQGTIREEVSEKVYVKLKAISSTGLTYITISNLIAVPLSTDNINIWIRKESNLYTATIDNTDAS